jgi:hypothetical protein
MFAKRRAIPTSVNRRPLHLQLPVPLLSYCIVDERAVEGGYRVEPRSYDDNAVSAFIANGHVEIAAAVAIEAPHAPPPHQDALRCPPSGDSTSPPRTVAAASALSPPIARGIDVFTAAGLFRSAAISIR